MNHVRKRKKLRTLLFGLILIMAIIGAFFWYRYSQYQYYLKTAVDPTDTENISIVIKKWSAEDNEDHIESLAQKLQDQELILDADTFTWYVKSNRFDRKLVAGRFIIQRNMTIPQIVEVITDIRKGEVVLTVPEGSTIAEIDQKLTDLDLIQAGQFIEATKKFDRYEQYSFLDEKANRALPHPLEGFLFPDTYFLNAAEFYPENLIQLMLKTFEKRMAEHIAGKDAEMIFQNVTVASMVEKEVKTAKDRPVVAGIIWKRLEENWQLGIDATLLYLKNDRTIDASDLSEDSPYNTRKNRGLPPGPISNPGLKSLQAAFTPETTEYYYYLTKPSSGEVVYARTNDEHNENRGKYLR